MPDREEVQRAAGQPTEEREEGESGTDLKREMGLISVFGTILSRDIPHVARDGVNSVSSREWIS